MLRASAAYALELGVPKLALALAERASDDQPEDAGLLDLRAVASFEAGALDSAFNVSGRAIETGGQTPLREFVRADSTRRRGDPSRAVDLARSALERYPADAGLAACLAESLLELRRPNDAVEILDEALRRTADTWQLHDLRARAAHDLGDVETQVEHERKIADLRRGDPSTTIRLVRTLLGAGEDDEARAILIESIAMEPTHRGLRLALIDTVLPPRWIRIALKVFPFVLAVAVAAIVSGPMGQGSPEPGAPQPGVLAFLVGCGLSVAARRAWMERAAGHDFPAVREAQRGLLPEIAREVGRRRKFVLLAGAISALWATILAVLYTTTLDWSPWVVWSAVFIGVFAVISLGGWISGWLVRQRPKENPFVRIPAGLCVCDETMLLHGRRAESYLQGHLTGDGSPVAAHVERVACPRIGASWLVVSEAIEGFDTPILLHVVESTEPEPVGLYL
jgi:tetratricopeptide (TPR) repeat protein